MKKISFIAFALCLCASVFAYERVGQLNPYAYGITPQVKGQKIGLSYQLNAPATATEIVIYRDGVEVGTQAVEENGEGLHSAVVDLSSYTVGGTYTVGIRVHGTSVDAPTQLKEVLDGSSDTTALFYGFDHPKAVDVDVNPASPYFGRILAAEALNSPGAWWSEGKCGIYAFDPTFTPIPNGNERAFTGGQTLDSYSPYRIRIAKDGRIFATSQCDQTPIMWEISADLQTWTPFFVGSYDDGLSYMTSDGKYIAGTNCGFDLDGEGEDLQLLMLSANKTAYGSYDPKDFFVSKYNVGTATSWAAEATEFDTLKNFCAEAAGIVVLSANICSDHEGGWWFKSTRANAVGQHGMFHVNAEGVKDFDLGVDCLTAADSANYGVHPTNGNNGGGGIRVIDDMLIIGTGRYSSGCGRCVIMEIGADATGKTTLTKRYDFEFIGISTNLNDFAMDYAHNLYVVGNSNEKLCVAAMPYSGSVETPVIAEVVIEGSAVENVEAAPVVEKFIENGQVVIVKDGVRYNALGARI